jgi:hypothetical protein
LSLSRIEAGKTVQEKVQYRMVGAAQHAAAWPGGVGVVVAWHRGRLAALRIASSSRPEGRRAGVPTGNMNKLASATPRRDQRWSRIFTVNYDLKISSNQMDMI